MTDVPYSTNTNIFIFGGSAICPTCFELQGIDINTLFVGDFTSFNSRHYGRN